MVIYRNWILHFVQNDKKNKILNNSRMQTF